MSRQRELVGRPRPGRPVRDRSVLDAPSRDSVEGLIEVLDLAADLAGPAPDDAGPAVPGPRCPADTTTHAAIHLTDSARLRLQPAAADGAVETTTDCLPTDDATTGEDVPSSSRRTTGRHRMPRPPRRRAPILLLALVIGGVLAALPGGVASRVGSSAPAEAGDYGLSASGANFAGGMDDESSRREITQAEAAARLDALAASRAEREPDFALPTEGRMTTCFCQRWGQMHWGLDLAAPLGTAIVAAADGVVLRAGAASGYGNAIYIQDADGNVQVYGHMRYLYVEAGDVVSAGDLIAKVGNEGQSTGPHLHFEIHEGSMTGRPVDPQEWLSDRGIEVSA